MPLITKAFAALPWVGDEGGDEGEEGGERVTGEVERFGGVVGVEEVDDVEVEAFLEPNDVFLCPVKDLQCGGVRVVEDCCSEGQTLTMDGSVKTSFKHSSSSRRARESMTKSSSRVLICMRQTKP